MKGRKKILETPELSEAMQIKYAGKCVAIVDGKVVASGMNSFDVFKKAREKYLDISTNQIIMDYIPSEDFRIFNHLNRR